jgi:hypothetical protein
MAKLVFFTQHKQCPHPLGAFARSGHAQQDAAFLRGHFSLEDFAEN